MSVLVPGNSNLIFRRFELKAGESAGGHSHNYDHSMLVVSGGPITVRGRRTADDVPVGDVYETTIHAGDDPLLILADWHHEIKASGPVKYFCIFAARDDKGNVVAKWNGNMDAAG